MRYLTSPFKRRHFALAAMVSLLCNTSVPSVQAASETEVAENTGLTEFVLPANGQLQAGAPVVVVGSGIGMQQAQNGLTGGAPQTTVIIAPISGTLTQLSAPDGQPVLAVQAPLTGQVSESTVKGGEYQIIVIDNDELAQVEDAKEWKWEEIPDEAGKTEIAVGAQFPVILLSAHNSKTAKVGHPVEGRLNIDIKIGGKLVANKGCRVIGHVFRVRPARRLLHAELSPSSWMKANGAIGIQFDEIISQSGEHLPLVAKPARQPRIVVNKYEGRVMGVNLQGEVAPPLSTQLKGQAAHLAIRAGCAAAGVFSMGAVPLAYGVVGAMNPSFAFLKPVGLNVRHRRLKGFAMGVCQGLPGGFLVSDMIIRGPEAIVRPGDIFLVEFKQTFTGEPATAAELLPGASTKVQGEVLSGVPNKKGAKNKKTK